MWWREVHSTPVEPADSAGEPLQIDPSASVSPTATLDITRGPIRVGARSRICAGAHIQGPVVIGDDCLIGNLALLRGRTTLGAGTRIGFATEIKNSIIEDGVAIGPQCFVADSKVERGAYLGAQVRTSNHRLDRRNVEVMTDGRRVDTGFDKLGCRIGAGASLGIQVIILPGREIAPGSVIAPKIIIERNLPTGRYRVAQQLEAF